MAGGIQFQKVATKGLAGTYSDGLKTRPLRQSTAQFNPR
jgi:hypothetical protein